MVMLSFKSKKSIETFTNNCPSVSVVALHFLLETSLIYYL